MNKKIVGPRTRTVRDAYKSYEVACKKENKKALPYWMYREIIERVNKKASDMIIFGGTFNLQNTLGYLRIKKIKRNYKKLVPDWGESNKLKKQLLAEGKVPKDQDHPDGEQWMVFFSDPWYLRWAWIKRGVCRVKNQSFYLFQPTANRSKTAGDNSLEKLGNRGLLVLANRTNPVLHYNYDN